jgi:hypothetical protein
MTAINAARTGGTTCPGDASPRFAAALTATTTMTPGAREYAWELAYEQYAMGNGASCNGRTFAQRQQTYSANGGLSLYSNTGAFVDLMGVVNVWRTNATLCPVLMNTSSTQCSTAVARDALDSYVMWLK